MPKKSLIKKKEAKQASREKVRQGLINSASGEWLPGTKSGAEETMVKHMREGYGFRS